MMLLLLGCAFRPPAHPPEMAVARGPFRVVVVPPEAMLGGDILFGVRAGSAYDPPGREGLAALTAAIVALSAGVEVEVGPELVTFRVPPEQKERFLSTLRQPPVDDRWIAAVPVTTPDCLQVADAALDTLLYRGHPYGHPSWGRSSVRSTFSPAEVQAFFGRRYVNAGAAAVAEAPFDLPFLLPSHASGVATPATWRPPEQSALTVVEAPVAETCVAFAAVGWTPGTPEEKATIDLLRAFWGDHAPSAVRRQDTLRLRVTDLVGAEGLQGFVETLGRLQEDGFTEEEFAAAHAVATPWGWRRWAADSLAMTLLPDLPELRGAAAALSALDRAAANAILKQHLDLALSQLVVVTNDFSGPSSTEAFPGAGVPSVMTSKDLFR